ncbi:MAG: UDP-N-acetylmuramoyl-L-alanyl-D-glutamate--2,6-diaminopimelate ligase [Ruminococcaceae bacterium]|nr:UDP-N-acetylmuramoyl-L-alanyl-D-glutamate--2,6-diaminopimelate ligase [Oscillospiraceae bacterium]
MRLSELCVGLDIPRGFENTEIGGVKTDSRRVEKGDLFICIRGLHADGHSFAEDAVKRGAAAILVCEDYEGTPNVLLLRTKDTRSAAARIYNAWYGDPASKLHVIAVTGTNGKTSVTFMLRAIFEAALYRCGLIGTVSCYSAGRRMEIRSENPLANMTTPDPEELYRILAEMVKDGVEYVFMEVTSHALALGKPDAIHFDAAVFTNLTPEHLDFHGDMATYFETKKRLFDLCDRAVLNIDDAYGARLADELQLPFVTCSAKGKNADYVATQICNHGVDGNEYRVVSADKRFTVRTQIPGTFSVINSLEAAACASMLGIPPGVIMTALGALAGIDGRMERVRLGVLVEYSVFIDYAHTPDALENLLMTARSLCRDGERVVLLFGCGGDRDKSKRRVMGEIAARLADFVILTSDNSRSEEPMEIIREIQEGLVGSDYVIVPERRRAIEFAIREAHDGDVILLAGKGHEEYEIDRLGKRFFSEKQIAVEAAGKYKSEREKL